MVTVSHIVEKTIRDKPFVQEALARGIINNAALAEELIPLVEKDLGKKVKFSAVNMAIRRYAEKLEKTFVPKARFSRNSDITIKSDLVMITLYKFDDIENCIKRISGIVELRKGDFLTITQGLNEVMIITNERHEKQIMEVVSKKSIKKTIKSLSSVTIHMGMDSLETVGLFYTATRALVWENINILDIVSTLTEMTFIVKEDDTARVFNALKDMIKESVDKKEYNRK